MTISPKTHVNKEPRTTSSILNSKDFNWPLRLTDLGMPCGFEPDHLESTFSGFLSLLRMLCKFAPPKSKSGTTQTYGYR